MYESMLYFPNFYVKFDFQYMYMSGWPIKFSLEDVEVTSSHCHILGIQNLRIIALPISVYMASPFVRSVRRISLSSLLRPSPSYSLSLRKIAHHPELIFAQSGPLTQFNPSKPWWVFRNFSHRSVNLVISQGKPKFETQEVDPPKKEKWKNKKRLKQQRMREKRKRKSANKRDPRCLGVKGKKKKQKFANAEERIKYKLEKARIKETLLIERLKRYEVPKLQGPAIKLDELTGEERFYMKKMGQKGSNYVPVGRRGIFGGVILNMHMHWKKHETVKVICKPCKPGQVHEYAEEIARLSGGTPVQIVGDDTIIFYRGKSYIQPQVMSPIDTLSKKRALEKSKYEQSLESVRRFIAIAEKELELYYRHVALYGDPNNRNSSSVLDNPRKGSSVPNKVGLSETEDDFEDESDSTDQELSGTEDAFEDEGLSVCEPDCEDENMSSHDLDSCDDARENSSFGTLESSTAMLGSPSMFRSKWDSDNQEFPRENTLKSVNLISFI